jgi:Na+/H+ antiporter NhaD/arsenite permease-like protein
MDGLTHHASWVLIVFLMGYIAIAIEQYVKINKASTALLMSVACWSILFLEPDESVDRHLETLSRQMFKVSQVLFFLMGALTIVEIINVHKGFRLITQFLYVESKKRLLWLTGFITFFMSSVLDNLTTAIVMVSLIHKLVEEREDRLIIGGVIVIAANAGGAWTPIGDVATTLLWINGQVTTLAIMRDIFLPSLACLAVPLLWFNAGFTGKLAIKKENQEQQTEPWGEFILFLGIASLIFVPFFKLLTDLPAFIGMMLGLGVMWLMTDLLHYRYEERNYLRVTAILPKVDISIIFFYLGILLSIMALESAGLLKAMAGWLSAHVPSGKMIAVIIGLLSSVVDNVSLVAATIGMYGLDSYPTDSTFWQLIAYCAGTGGSILIIGSAAGVAFMALEKVDFMWYTKHIAPKALLGYFAGILLYLGIYALI